MEAGGRRFYSGRRSYRLTFFRWLERGSETAEEPFGVENSISMGAGDVEDWRFLGRYGGEVISAV